MATLFWPHGEKITDTYGGESLRMFLSSLTKVWNSWANFAELSLGYKSSKSLIESGVRLGHGWSYNISFIESAVMVKRTFYP